MSMQVYLDNSATTRPCAQAVEAVAQSMTEAFHNPSALYAPAMRAEHALADARHAIAATLHAQEKNVIFTSGGTEADDTRCKVCPLFFEPRRLKSALPDGFRQG